MTIPPDLEAQILRYHHVEKWRAGTIARQLALRHGVARVATGRSVAERVIDTPLAGRAVSAIHS